MVDLDKVKSKLGAKIGLIGSVILLIVGLSSASMASMYYEVGYPIYIHYIQAIVTAAISALGMFGAVLVFRDNFTGYTFLLLAGIIGIIGTFIPIYVYIDEWDWTNTFYLSSSAAFIDLVLMLVGGILGFALAEKKERNE
jgi:ABC-type molybdate transport system permease subunit